MDNQPNSPPSHPIPQAPLVTPEDPQQQQYPEPEQTVFNPEWLQSPDQKELNQYDPRTGISAYDRRTKLTEGVSRDVAILDMDNAFSVIRMAPDQLKELILRVTEEDLMAPERDLRERFRPSATENLFRLNFWIEYSRCHQDKQAKIYMSNIVRGICPTQYFYVFYEKRPERLAWVLCPPQSYETRLEEALDYSVYRMREILDQALIKNDGNVDTALGNLMLKVTQFLDAKINGAIASRVQIDQRVDQRTAVVHTNATELGKMTAQVTMADLDRKLKELEELTGKPTNQLPDRSKEAAIAAEFAEIIERDPVAVDRSYEPVVHNGAVITRKL